MTLRSFLRWWLRGLRATAVAVDETLTQRRLHARLDAEYERDTADIAAFKARRQPLAYQYRSIEVLLSLPTVTPDRSGYARDGGELDSVNAVAFWMVHDLCWPGVSGFTPFHPRQTAVYWLALRESVTGVRLS